MNRLLIIAALLMFLSGCNGSEDTLSPTKSPSLTKSPSPTKSPASTESPAPTEPPAPSSVSTPLPLSGFVLQSTTGQHNDGNFTRLRPSKNANRYDYVDIEVSMDEMSSALKVIIDFRITEDKNGNPSTTFFIASGNPEKLDETNGLYFFNEPEFIYECGQSAEFEKRALLDNQIYQVTIDSEKIDDTQCLINYMQTESDNSFIIEITTKDGLVTSVNNLDTEIVYDVVDANYSP